MYQEVVIIEVKEDYSLAMSRSGQVIRIKNKAGMHVGARIYVTEEDLFQSAATDKVVPMRSKRKGSAKPWWKALALAAMALLLIGTGTWASQWLQRENALAVGQNPSVQVTTNRDQQVTGVYDANAQPHSDSELKGKGLSEVLDDLLGSIKYPENENILVAMTKTDEVSMRKIEEAISKYFQDSGYSGDLIFLRGESSEFRAAKEAGRSYTSYLVDQYQLDIWNKDQNDDLSDQEKASRLSGHGGFRSINNQEQEDEKDKEKEDKEDDKKEEKNESQQSSNDSKAQNQQNNQQDQSAPAGNQPQTAPENATPRQAPSRPAPQPSQPAPAQPAPQPSQPQSPPLYYPSGDDDDWDDDWDDDDWDDD
ncbi:anti-sigma factor domain-containing protein [Aerococcus sp. CDC-944-U94]|uniref:anti-sigma factor domain-containing protein n=1 Tax=Aerococcus urinae (strain CCUG 59500 / ACS-120-V-Col10a) TaxID=2976812 RepID=UPI00227D6CAD|nr:anti-sigma factor domain-containing protein [Aerococcus sp. Group 1]MCY3054208.1 anti-sigma factor domain-containing protein [Aerococcus sp. Group 1]MCY3055938.1 anti-sigma factor domain-containing protein [Aerococcus sp. Group 1]